MNNMRSLKLLLLFTTLTSGFVVKNSYNDKNVEPVTEITAFSPVTLKAHKSWFYEIDHAWHIGDAFCKYKPDSIWCRTSSETTTPTTTSINRFTEIAKPVDEHKENNNDLTTQKSTIRKSNTNNSLKTSTTIKNEAFRTDTTKSSAETIKPQQQTTDKFTLPRLNSTKLIATVTIEHETNSDTDTTLSSAQTTEAYLTPSVNRNQTTGKVLLETFSKVGRETTLPSMETTELFVVQPQSSSGDQIISKNLLNATTSQVLGTNTLVPTKILKSSSTDNRATGESLLESTTILGIDTTFSSKETAEFSTESPTFTDVDRITSEIPLNDMTSHTQDENSPVSPEVPESSSTGSFISDEQATDKSLLKNTTPSTSTSIAFESTRSPTKTEKPDDLWDEICLYVEALCAYFNAEKWCDVKKLRAVPKLPKRVIISV